MIRDMQSTNIYIYIFNPKQNKTKQTTLNLYLDFRLSKFVRLKQKI